MKMRQEKKSQVNLLPELRLNEKDGTQRILCKTNILEREIVPIRVIAKRLPCVKLTKD